LLQRFVAAYNRSHFDFGKHSISKLDGATLDGATRNGSDVQFLVIGRYFLRGGHRRTKNIYPSNSA
jgi:hypothetical protein